MSSEIAIKVEGLSKCFEIYEQPRDRLKQFILPHLYKSFGKPAKQYFREFWALRGICFEVKKGETVGIVGRNGSGKSTLLQIICGTLSPSCGTISTNGRIAALLELGSGFNPEFTGRENVYLNGAVLGLSRSEIDGRFDAITEFADIGPFIDQPVKTYSSGMVVRLAFAVAINVDPQILVVDEALSVGDELFQRKCFSKIEVLRSAGTTILFVSHSGGTVVELCDRAILLDSGECLAIDAPKKIVGRYQKLLYAPEYRREFIRAEIRKNIAEDPQYFSLDSEKKSHEFSVPLDIENELPDSYDPFLKPTSLIEYESYGAIIESPQIYNLQGELVNILTRGRIYRYCYKVIFSQPANNVRFGMLIKTPSGVDLGGAASSPSNRTSVPFVTSSSIFKVEFEFCCRLNAGVYFLNAGVVGEINGSETYLHRLIDAAMFRVLSESENMSTGIIDFSCLPHIELSVN
jgi:lipopolysaccharide transport system ATP-binding protein